MNGLKLPDPANLNKEWTSSKAKLDVRQQPPSTYYGVTTELTHIVKKDSLHANGI